MSEVERFKALFTGLDRSYGQWIISTNKAKTVKQLLTDKQWEHHLEGKVGLGVVPIQESNQCIWGALDIDENTIDHYALYIKIQKAKLPLVVCRSKSGGAHCYTFLKTPVKASVLRKVLARYASLIGYGQCEVFPKQDTLGDSAGSWINLPYLGSNTTNRYAIGDVETEPLSLMEFLNAAEYVKENNTAKVVKTEANDVKGLPPCLMYFQQNGIPEGARNEVMFNFATYLKKSKGEAWQEEFIKLNSQLPKTPLPNREMQTLIKSIDKKEYNYKCKTTVIANQCDRISCLSLDFGIRDNSNYHEFIVGGITKIATDPPFWVLDVNGTDVRMTTIQLYSFTAVRMRCMEVFGGMVPPVKDEEWRQLLQMRLSTSLTVQEAPKDAGETGRLMTGFMEFIRMAGRSKRREDIMHGVPVIDRIMIEDPITGESKKTDVVLFKSADLIGYLQRKKVIAFLPNNELWAIFREAGCGHDKVRVGKRVITAWYYPLTIEQVEDIRTSVAMPTLPEHEL